MGTMESTSTGISGRGGDVGSGVELAARAGYVAKGIVFATIGVLAAMSAFGYASGTLVGTRSALDVLRSQAAGQILLWVLAAGLAGYTVWRFVQAIADPEDKGDDATGLVRRGGLAISGLIYAGLAFFAVRLALGGGGGGGDMKRESAGWVMSLPGGAWLVGLVGVGFLVVAAWQGWRAYDASFEKHWRRGVLEGGKRELASKLSRFGIASRAVGFALIGWFAIQAALQSSPDRADGLAAAFRTIASQTFGTVALAVIATGFVCYGLYCFANARLKRIG